MTYTADIMEIKSGRTWREYFSSPYFLWKRVNKLRFSKKLKVLSHTYIANC
jgi:hypothetical protein